jgi:hypothetical protein
MEAVIVLYVVLIVVIFASLWKVFTKAGEPGWAGIIPIYNYMVMARISGKPDWYGLLVLVPCVGIIFAFIILIELAKSFGKGAGFGIGLALLGFIFFPILAFSDAEYIGPGGSRRSRRRFDDEDDDDDRPRSRGRGRDRDDDDDDDDRPRGRGRARDDDDDDDRPRRR